jgi:endonuclease YncB( thermonuclease family)
VSPTKRLKLILALFLLVIVGNRNVTSQDNTRQIEIGIAVYVVDGDTVDVQLGGTIQRVRYIGMNTPERGEPCAREVTAANTALVDGRTVAMIRDVSETDRYGRLLRYVYVEGTFVNAALVADGWAESVRYPPDTMFAAWFDHLEEQARAPTSGVIPLACLGPHRPRQRLLRYLLGQQRFRRNARLELRGKSLQLRGWFTSAEK